MTLGRREDLCVGSGMLCSQEVMGALIYLDGARVDESLRSSDFIKVECSNGF